MTDDARLQDVLTCSRLPSLPAVAVQLLELTSNPDVSMSEITRLVQQDQALAAKVLKTVNSSFYGLSTPCGSIDRAMKYLGLNTVKSLVLGFSLVDTTQASCDEGFDLMSHWRRAIIGATGARAIALIIGGIDAEEAFTASLFQDVGMLACFAAMKRRYTMEIQGVAHRKLCDVEQKLFGFDHATVGAELAIQWKLPPEISEAIRYHHNPKAAPKAHAAIARVVAIGAMISSAMDDDALDTAVRAIERVMSEWYGRAAPNMTKLLSDVAETSKTLAKMFQQDIGELPDVSEIMAQAQEQGLEHQMQMQREADKLAREAFIDGLTRIANRKSFDAELERVYNAFVKEDRGFGVLFFDADRFKSVNDTHGHAAGDAVLVELAQRTSEAVGDQGIVCRYGGEEFAVIVEGQGIDQCAELAERVREAIGSKPFDLRAVDGAPDELPVTVSIGVSSTDAGIPTRLSGADQVVHEADECVYAAKSDGRNNVKVWGRFAQASIPNTNKPDEQGAGPEPAPQAPAQPRKSKILLIEDDALAATLVTTLIKKRGKVEVQWVKSGSKACLMIGSGQLSGEELPSLILCDFNLPGCDGHEVLRMAKKYPEFADIPFVMLSATSDEHTKDETMRLGATMFIEKGEFCEEINKWIGELISSSRPAA